MRRVKEVAAGIHASMKAGCIQGDIVWLTRLTVITELFKGQFYGKYVQLLLSRGNIMTRGVNLARTQNNLGFLLILLSSSSDTNRKTNAEKTGEAPQPRTSSDWTSAQQTTVYHITTLITY